MLLSDHLPGEKLILTEEKWSSARFFLFVEVPGKGKICEESEDFSRMQKPSGQKGFLELPHCPPNPESALKSLKYTSRLLAHSDFRENDYRLRVVDTWSSS
jgi:hypothetical protein